MLPAEELSLIASRALRCRYRDGEIIHERGDERPELSVVLTGKVKLIYPRRDGLEIFSGLIHTGQNYGDFELVHARLRAYRAVAIGDTVVDHLRGAALQAVLERPAIVAALYHVASFRLGVTIDLLDDMRMLPPEARLAKLIVRMQDAAEGAAELAFPQEDFAGMLGISTVTLAKSLRLLRDLGMIETGYRQITVRNRAGLDTWVRGWSGD